MYNKLRLLGICFLCCFGIPQGYAIANAPSAAEELNILIDVSGSMQQNDPYNLRISALKLLINLLPTGTKVGIWTFAENTNALVAVGAVDDPWKQNALSKIKGIHSNGLFTHIEDALQTATEQWVSTEAEQNRHLILLTDGMVDVSKDIMQSAESRETILVEMIPLLQQARIQVQAIALSDHADVELLDKLAFDTNGWSETAESAEQLEKVFFNMFKKAVPQDTIPLSGNTFTIDSSINEFSLLVFKKPASPKTQLIKPDNSLLDSTGKNTDVAWVMEQSYDLITVTSPAPGEWKIVADMDPDNQVMIVTDLKFQLDPIPNHIGEKEQLVLNAYFTDRDQLISKKEFLDLIRIRIEQVPEKSADRQWEMLPVADSPGMFSQNLGVLAQGKYKLKISVDGKTFQRERIQTVEVVASPISVETKISEKERVATVKLTINESLINTQMMTVQAIINQAGQEPEMRVIEEKEGSWQFEIAAPEPGKHKIVNFAVMAQTLQGNAISPDIKPVIIKDSLFQTLQTEKEPALETEAIEQAVKTSSIIKSIEPVTDKGADDDDIAVNWIKISGIVLIINLVLILTGFFGFKFFKKRAAEKQAELLDRLS